MREGTRQRQEWLPQVVENNESACCPGIEVDNGDDRGMEELETWKKGRDGGELEPQRLKALSL